MTDSRTPALLPHRTLLVLLITLGVIVAPHVVHLPPWLTAAAVVCGVWRYTLAVRGGRLPPGPARIVLTVGASAGVFLSYGTILGRDAGVALLTAMCALKLLEMRRRRDTTILLFLAYFLIATQFLYYQSPPAILYLLVAAWATTMLLIAIHRPTGTESPFRHARLAGALLLQALPLAVVLFVLFPRVSGPLWGLPKDAGAGMTGLSDTMSPGSISQLSRSDAVAFRVEFQGRPPPRSQRYWRGPVFNWYDGQTWSYHQSFARPEDISTVGLEPLSAPLRYSVILEPHNHRWLFALDMPVQPPPDARLSPTMELLAGHAIHEPRRYSVGSVLRYRLQPALGAEQARRDLSLPFDRDPRAHALAQQWRDQARTPEDVVDRALHYFRKQPFVYTLNPPPLDSENAVDAFLFDTRRGFCEHFAGAFVVLMRAAGIPARVVTGYQGGTMNPLSDYMIVRQSDAHAWAEVWLPNKGWVREDPTAWVSPDRVELGMGSAVADRDEVPLMARPGGYWLADLRLGWDTVNTAWTRWVLAYGPDLQHDLLKGMGLGSLPRVGLALGTAFAGILGLLSAMLLRDRRARESDPAREAYQAYCHKLARAGVPRMEAEGPEDYARRAAGIRPDLALKIRAITDVYVLLRYRGRRNPKWERHLRRLVQSFRA